MWWVTQMSDQRTVKRIVPSRMLAWLCHLANAGRPSRTFYELKDQLLRQFATFCGHDIQEITKPCWGDQRDAYGDWHGCGPLCRRCGGTGIFDQRWVRLQRWLWQQYVFHIPDGDTRKRPDSVQIVGRVEHPDYGLASREAELWLYLLTLQLGRFWHVASTSCYAYPKYFPLCRLQRLLMWMRMTFSTRRCWCGRRFVTWGSGWQICRPCRRRTESHHTDELPF